MVRGGGGRVVALSKMRSTISPCTKEEGDAADLRLVMMAWYSGALCMEPSTSWVAGVEEWPGAAGGTGAGMVGVEWVDGWLGKWAVTRRWKKGWEKKGKEGAKGKGRKGETRGEDGH